MSAPARLLALRLQGFKSFAERTLIEFGPGISAVVGPNGSGKSNLADALRWSLGEQGRALRSRKSEDVIFAGSDRRSALGMADVTIVLDNGDGLLPVDYAVLELGRRLYRSGENDYLLNKQRIRLRDLVDLLDGAHLADNAFLFIGQGMVDQALALRPEERRPLFEEVAGVRRHERRRRKAEDQLTESEANLARVEDILAELRPQARRLAAQAEQQATRLTAGEELADALIAAAHVRWHEAATAAAAATARVERERRDADQAMVELQTAEDAAGAIAAEMASRAATERERESGHETARGRVTELRLRETRLVGELESIARDRARLDTERETAEASLAVQRRGLSLPIPPRDHDLDGALAEAERLVAEASGELLSLRAASRARGEEAAAIRRAEAARQAESETARRRLADASRRLDAEAAAAVEVQARRAELTGRQGAARTDLEAASRAAEESAAARESARAAAGETEARRGGANQRSAGAAAALVAQRARLDALERRIREEDERGIARAAKRRGGRRLDDELVVEPSLRPAVEAALDELSRAYVVDEAAAVELATERGMLVIRERLAGSAVADAAARKVADRLGAAGGVPLAEAIRRDPTGAVTQLLARVAVVADLPTALSLQPDLPTGWTLVVRDGSAVVTAVAVRLGRGDAPLERRADAERLRLAVAQLTGAATAAAAEADVAEREAVGARSALDAAAAAESRATAERRRAEEAERAAARELEAVVREAGWHAAQVDRLTGEVERAREALAALEGATLWAVGDGDVPGEAGQARAIGSPTAAGPAVPPTDEAAIALWEARAADLRARRDRLAAEQAASDAARREIEGRRARAEATVAMDEERIVRAERDAIALARREEDLIEGRRLLGQELAAAAATETHAAAALSEIRAADSVARERLSGAERDAAAARERLRHADERLRAADRSDLEARLGRDSLREQLLVELAGLGDLGRIRLEAEAGVVPVAVGPGLAPGLVEGRLGATSPEPVDPSDEDATDEDESTEAAGLEAALDAVAVRWATEVPPAVPPSPGRLAHLRRRYHELGAANPFAVEEHAAVRERLDTLDTQQRDLRSAIDKTRQLIAELNTMIADQFRTTFAALETAFDVRFQQLFGGGYARLSLTDPDDLAATGVEIVARPPGKKAQALAMLSGGERALTAVALLFAMLEVRPVPFCVLDEVDAALDEANVGRFSDALRSLADRTQFIVITHNRGTIEAADALYGVTVGDDSVSRVISLRLDEAQAIADRQRGAPLDVAAPVDVDGELAEVG
ncbi:MAG TPA: AAA family ATPase [Verrucomicrobiae bacterium]|nr:AAA family ATPase [Verrucomicrobiae bacterium]